MELEEDVSGAVDESGPESSYSLAGRRLALEGHGWRRTVEGGDGGTMAVSQAAAWPGGVVPGGNVGLPAGMALEGLGVGVRDRSVRHLGCVPWTLMEAVGTCNAGRREGDGEN